jgi:hypothetical protein
LILLLLLLQKHRIAAVDIDSSSSYRCFGSTKILSVQARGAQIFSNVTIHFTYTAVSPVKAVVAADIAIAIDIAIVAETSC